MDEMKRTSNIENCVLTSMLNSFEDPTKKKNLKYLIMNA